MTKRFFALTLALCLALALAGCGERAKPSDQPPTQPSSIEVRPSQADEPGEPAPDGPDPAPEAPADLDALVKEIVLTYGAEEDTLNGPARLIPTDISLFISDTSWEGAGELTPGDYFAWFFSTTMKEDYEYKREAYRHPKGEDYGWFFPQDLYEERVQTYFEVSTDHLRSDPTYYQAEYQGYCLGSGGGRGESPTLAYQYTRDGELLTIQVTRSYESGAFPDTCHTLTVRLEDGGGWKYLGDQVE